MGTQYSLSDNKPVSCYVRQTTDGGATWAPPPSFVTATLRDVSFVGRTKGWAVGADGTIMVTTDGGEHWTTQAAPVAVGLADVDFVDGTDRLGRRRRRDDPGDRRRRHDVASAAVAVGRRPRRRELR